MSHLLLTFFLLLSLLSSLQGTKHDNDQAQFQLQQSSMAMDPHERETLFQVMDSMSSDRDWRSSNPEPCTSSWPGIECKPASDSRLFHVTRLDFGAPPNPTCRASATFPSQIFDLPNLQSIFFFDCFRATRTNLSLPPPTHDAAAAYASLQQLSLKSNPSLVGAIPSHISSLSSLQVLTLSQNNLSGTIPKSISELTSLVHLDLSYNSLTGSIPTQIGELKKLLGLDLSYNSLNGAIPPSMGQLSLLQKLDLSSNGLVGRIPESLDNLSFLAFLALSNNKLSGALPESMTKLQNLQYLIMDDNPMFVPLPTQLGRLAKLQELRLANSGYSGTIPDSFARLTNLTSLSLENNRLTGVIPAGLNGLSRLYHLNLSRNFLSGVVPFGSGFLKRLGRNLDLSGNSGLCLGSSEESEGIGADNCGAKTNASSLQKPLGRSSGAPLMFCKFYCQLIGFLAFWSGYYSLLYK